MRIDHRIVTTCCVVLLLTGCDGREELSYYHQRVSNQPLNQWDGSVSWSDGSTPAKVYAVTLTAEAITASQRIGLVEFEVRMSLDENERLVGVDIVEKEEILLHGHRIVCDLVFQDWVAHGQFGLSPKSGTDGHFVAWPGDGPQAIAWQAPDVPNPTPVVSFTIHWAHSPTGELTFDNVEATASHVGWVEGLKWDLSLVFPDGGSQRRTPL